MYDRWIRVLWFADQPASECGRVLIVGHSVRVMKGPRVYFEKRCVLE